MLLKWALLFVAISPVASARSMGGRPIISRPSAISGKQQGVALSKTTLTKFGKPAFIASSPLSNEIDMCLHLRGGGYSEAAAVVGNVPYQKIIETIVTAVTTTVKMCLPPVVAATRTVAAFYRNLPKDAIVAQVGLVYCFCGGCYPALFAAVQAAQVCGLQRMIGALGDLTDEAVIAVDAASNRINKQTQSTREMFSEMTLVVMKSVDPTKVR
jgi:hypothetical protein